MQGHTEANTLNPANPVHPVKKKTSLTFLISRGTPFLLALSINKRKNSLIAGAVAGKRQRPFMKHRANQKMKKKLLFPVVEGKKTYWPSKAVCPICGRGKVLEPHSMAILSAGALLVDRKRKYGVPSDKLDGFLSLSWHGAHDAGKGKHREIGCAVNIMFDVIGGQADLYFCSTKCLRRFFDKCVDELEGRMAEEMKRMIDSEPEMSYLI